MTHCSTHASGDWAPARAITAFVPSTTRVGWPDWTAGWSAPALGLTTPSVIRAAGAAMGDAGAGLSWSAASCRSSPASGAARLSRLSRPSRRHTERAALGAAATTRRGPRPPGANARRRPALREPPSSSARAMKSPREQAGRPPAPSATASPNSASSSLSESSSANAQKRLPDHPAAPRGGAAVRLGTGARAAAQPAAGSSAGA